LQQNSMVAGKRTRPTGAWKLFQYKIKNILHALTS
jgi:hypothetical protein